MLQDQLSWRHHYIPEFYLKRWRAANGKLVEFSKPYGDEVRPKRRAPRATGFVDRLYALEGLPDSLSAAVEQKYFSPVDSRAATVLQKMEAGGAVLDDADRVAWTQFLISLVFRHPENVTATKARLRESLPETTQEDEKRWRAQRRPGDPKTLREAMKDEMERDPHRVSRQAINVIAAVSSSEKIGSKLATLYWGSFRTHLTCPALFTSDRPVHWYGGLDDAGFHLLMPITPKRIFYAVGSPEMEMLITTQQPGVIALFVNEQTVRRARKFVYAMGDGDIAYVQNNMGQEGELSVADLVTKLPSAGAVRRHKAAFNPSWTGRRSSKTAPSRLRP